MEGKKKKKENRNQVLSQNTNIQYRLAMQYDTLHTIHATTQREETRERYTKRDKKSNWVTD